MRPETSAAAEWFREVFFAANKDIILKTPQIRRGTLAEDGKTPVVEVFEINISEHIRTQIRKELEPLPAMISVLVGNAIAELIDALKTPDQGKHQTENDN